MQFLKQWAISVCASGILGTVFSMIAPKGSMDKTIKLMISIFIFTSMVVPFLSADKMNMDDFYQTEHSAVSQEEMQLKSNELTMRATKISVEKAVLSFLDTHQYEDCRVSATLAVDEKKYISLTILQVYLNEENMKNGEQIKIQLVNEFKVETSILPMGAYRDET